MRRPCLAILLLTLCLPLAADDGRFIKPPGTDLGLPFTPGVLADDFLFLSGAIGNEPGTKVVDGDMAAQTERTMANLKAVLDAAGLDFSRVVDVNLYLSDARLLGPLRQAMAGYQDLYPASTLVEADIAIPGAFLEVSAIAARKGLEIRPITPEGWPQPGARYRWGMLAGDTLFISGQVGWDPASGRLRGSDVGAQTRQALANVEAILGAAGMSKKDVASCRVYLVDARDFAAMNDVYRQVFDAEPPARATIRARLAVPALLVEIQCTAVANATRKVVQPAGQKASDLPFSPAIQAGDRLYLSGMVGRGSDGYASGVEAQTEVVLERLRATLEAAGLGFSDVENATVYLTDIRHYPLMNAVYSRLMPDPPPARATVGSPLMSPEALVEIAMVARRGAENDSE